MFACAGDAHPVDSGGWISIRHPTGLSFSAPDGYPGTGPISERPRSPGSGKLEEGGVEQACLRLAATHLYLDACLTKLYDACTMSMSSGILCGYHGSGDTGIDKRLCAWSGLALVTAWLQGDIEGGVLRVKSPRLCSYVTHRLPHGDLPNSRCQPLPMTWPAFTSKAPTAGLGSTLLRPRLAITRACRMQLFVFRVHKPALKESWLCPGVGRCVFQQCEEAGFIQDGNAEIFSLGHVYYRGFPPQPQSPFSC